VSATGELEQFARCDPNDHAEHMLTEIALSVDKCASRTFVDDADRRLWDELVGDRGLPRGTVDYDDISANENVVEP
jgi:hypothetical protein